MAALRIVPVVWVSAHSVMNVPDWLPSGGEKVGWSPEVSAWPPWKVTSCPPATRGIDGAVTKVVTADWPVLVPVAYVGVVVSAPRTTTPAAAIRPAEEVTTTGTVVSEPVSTLRKQVIVAPVATSWKAAISTDHPD